jgi:hypothetical protein
MSAPAAGTDLQDFAVVIGIDVYQNLKALKGAVKDADAFRNWLLTAPGHNFSLETIYCVPALVNNAWPSPNGSGPRLHEMIQPFRELLKRSRDAKGFIGRRLYVFTAGHGVAGEERADAYLLAADTDENFMEYLACRQFADNFVNQALFKEVVLFCDCCRDYKWDLPGAHVPFPKGKSDLQAADRVPTFYAYAAGYGLKAREIHHGGGVRGAFTLALIRGLEGRAAPDGQVTSQSLREYLRRRVPELEGSQKAFFPFIEDLVLVDGLPAATTSVRVKLTAPAASFEVVDHRFRPVQVQPILQDDGEYLVELTPGRTYRFRALSSHKPGMHLSEQEVKLSEDEKYVQL